MRIRSISLKGYKRFKDLTIDLGDDPARIVALVGPNGCGKSSVFDALLFLQGAYENIGKTGQKDSWYHSLDQDPNYDTNNVNVVFTTGSLDEFRNSRRGQRNTLFSFRSSYRYNTEVKVDEIRSVEDIGRNQDGASTAIAMDSKMEINYRRLQAKYSRYRDDHDMRPSEARRHVVDELNRSLKACVDVEIEALGVVEDGRGTLYFGHRSKSGDSSLHTRAGLSRGTQCSGSDCPVTQGRASARGLVQRRRGRITEQREPVVDPLSGQALVSTGPLVPSPAPRAQIEPGTEQVEKALSGALVDVEIGA